MKPLRRTVAALVGAAAAVLVSVPAATAATVDDDPVVVWGVRPADGPQGSGRPNYSYVLTPGTTVEDAFVVTNHDEAPLTLQLYAADGYISDTGQLDVRGRDEESSDVGAWVRLATDEVTIEPGVGVEVPFTLSVPENATPGDHAGGIVSSMSPPGDAVVSVERRLGSRIHVRVEGDLRPGLAVTGMSVRHPGSTDLVPQGEADVRFTVTNTGNTRLAGTVGLRLQGPFGLFARQVEVPDVPELLPGAAFEVEVSVPDVPASVVLRATATLTPTTVDPSGAAGTTAPQPVRASAWSWAPPWLALGLLALVLLWAAQRGVRAYRRRAARRRAAGAAGATGAAGGGQADDPAPARGAGTDEAGARRAGEASHATEGAG